jgi:hypothetical protein
LAVARQLNRTLILTGIRKHYTDRTSQHALSSPLHQNSTILSNTTTQLQPCLREEAMHMVHLEDILDRYDYPYLSAVYIDIIAVGEKMTRHAPSAQLGDEQPIDQPDPLGLQPQMLAVQPAMCFCDVSEVIVRYL